MATDSLLAALESNYGMGQMAVDDVDTVRGLYKFCQKWIDGLAQAEELNNPCLAMAMQLRGAATKMESDLRSSTDMAPAMREPVQRTVTGYRAIADVLEELPEFAREENVNDFLDNLSAFEEERQAVLDAQQELELQLGGKIRLCPRCGSSGETSECEKCQLTRLYPDRGALSGSPIPRERTPGLYGKIYHTYLRVVMGERTLEALWPALEEFEEHLEELLFERKQMSKKLESGSLAGQRLAEVSQVETLLSEAEGYIQLALRGVERMKGVETNFRANDLTRGWDDIFHAGQALEGTAVRIRYELDDETDDGEAGEVEPAPMPRSLDDQISFSRE